MQKSTIISPIWKRIKSLRPHVRFGDLNFDKKFLFKNLCFVRPHATLVKERIATKSDAPDISARPKEQLALKPQNREATPLNREASNANNCSMDSRQQRLAVYAYMWAQYKNIQLKHIFFIRTREQGIAWDMLRILQNPQKIKTWPLSKKYAIRIVCEKDKEIPEIIQPILPDPYVHLTRVISYRN